MEHRPNVGSCAGLAESARGTEVYLLGAKAEVVVKTAEVLSRGIPMLMVLAGYRRRLLRGDDEVRRRGHMRLEDRQIQPDIMFVGITSPMKNALIERFRELGAMGAFVGVRSSFGVVSGIIPRAPMPECSIAREPDSSA